MKPFRAMNPVRIGAASIAVLAVLLLLAANYSALPVVGGGPKYVAQVTDAAGLKKDDQVQVAGVRVGKVESVELEGDHVNVSFRVKADVPLGQRTRASIRIRTMLGIKYLALEPDGPGQLSSDTPIPVSRTVTPFDVVPAFQGLGRTATDIDEQQLAEAFTTIADTFRETPDEVAVALDGLSRFSQAISSRDQQLAELLENARGVSQVLAERNEEFVRLLRDGDTLFRAVNERRALIGELLRNTQELSVQLQGLVADNRGDLQPALDRLQVVTDLLVRQQNNLATSVEFGAAYVRLFSNTIGTGQWFDTYIENFAEFPIDALLAESIGGLLGGGAPGGIPGVPLPGTGGGGGGAGGGGGGGAGGIPQLPTGSGTQGAAAPGGASLAGLLQVPDAPAVEPATGGAR